METAADIVAGIRTSRLLSMNSLADLAGVPASTISRIEAGKIEPTFAMLKKIVEAAGFCFASRLEDAGSDQPVASYIARLKSKNLEIRERPARELLAIARLMPVAKRRGARRLEIPKNLQEAVCRLDGQGQEPVISALEAYSGRISPQQSFVPIVYVNDPDSITGFKIATPRSPSVLFALPITDNVRQYAQLKRGVAMVASQWALMDALASPGRQPDAALEALAARDAVAL
jgi:transcriptional regulator with XRE-family HTH domain